MGGAAIQVVNPGSAARRLLTLILSNTLLPAWARVSPIVNKCSCSSSATGRPSAMAVWAVRPLQCEPMRHCGAVPPVTAAGQG